MRRYLVVGIDSSYSDKRSEALSPLVPRSAGERFWRMTGLTMEQYTQAFARDNLFFWGEKQRRNIDRRREAAQEVLRRFGGEESTVWVLALGRVVAEAFGMVNTQVPLVWRHRVVLIPHPSGLNRWYNDESNAARAREFVETVAADAIRGDRQ